VGNPFNVNHIDRDGRRLAGLVALTVALWALGGVGMAYVAGFGAVQRRLEMAHWWWLGLAFCGVTAAFCGYFFAYRGITLADDGPRIRLRELLAVVTAGFGGFFAHGGTVLDEYAMRAGGASRHEARSRVIALAGFEHGALAFLVCPAAVATLILGLVIPRGDFTWPWALIPPGGFAVAIWLAERYRQQLRERDGWRGRLGLFFDGVHVVWEILRRPASHGYAVAGMMLYWGGDMFALWASTRAFGFQMSALAVIVCLGTGMILTRRTAPLGGAGVMVVALTATLWYGAAVPFAAATLGVAAYRAFTLLAPIPFGFAALPKLRELGRRGKGAPQGHGTSADPGEPALEA
jgi:MFS family permease